MAEQGSSSAFTSVPLDGVGEWSSGRESGTSIVDQGVQQQAQLIGLLLRLGESALQTMIANGIEAEDFSEGGFEQLFLLVRSAYLSSQPCVLASLAPRVHEQGLDSAAATALASAESLTLADVPILAQACVKESLYRRGMIIISNAHGQLQTSVEGGAPPTEIARIFNATVFQLARLSKRLQR